MDLDTGLTIRGVVLAAISLFAQLRHLTETHEANSMNSFGMLFSLWSLLPAVVAGLPRTDVAS